MTAFNRDNEFVELNRTFKELRKNVQESDDMDFGWAYGFGESLRWDDLINEYRVIILSEAGSGKTTEIRHIASTLRAQNKQAFFLRLEYIPKVFELSFEVGTYQAFGEWLQSEEDGWIFLDSVDEARLRDPGDFELAIRIMGNRLQTVTNRVHIVITGRISAWRPKTDLDICVTHLPHDDTALHDAPQEGNCEVQDDHFEVKTEGEKGDKQVFKIVTLDDLTEKQIAVFAEARGVNDSEAFIDSVERADAWSFTSRPQDLQELIDFWLDKGQIGTGLEIMRNSIKRRLVERDQKRAESHPLSSDRAREGARLLAAATTLTRDQTIRVPDGADNNIGFAVQSVLANWDDRVQATLLSRPVFDGEIYGAVRFHHRTVREYLTAEWFAELLSRETSRRDIEGLFFQNQYNLEVVVPTLRPILPWLALLDERIGKRVYEIAPEIFFEGGDPSQLPLEMRQRILRDVCEQIASEGTSWPSHDRSAVQRFAKPELTDDVRELISKYADNDYLTQFLLYMVWLGQLEGLKQEVMEIALTPTTEKYVRSTAFRAIYAIGSEEEQENIRQSFLEEASGLQREWLTDLIEGAKPSEQTVTWLLACLEKSEFNEDYGFDRLADKVTEFVQSADIQLLPGLITGFNRLLNLPPMIEGWLCEVSKKYLGLLGPASKAIERLIFERHPASLEPDTLDILDKLSIADGYMSTSVRDTGSDFSKLVPEWPELNKALFWFGIGRARKAMSKQYNERLINYWRASVSGSFWRFEVDDFEYVTDEISRRNFIDDKLVALSLAFDLYVKAGRPRTWRENLKKLVREIGNAELSDRLKTCLKPPTQSEEARLRKRQNARWRRKREAQQRQQAKILADNKKWFADNLEGARKELRENPGVMTGPMYHLLQRTRVMESSSEQDIKHSWKTLIPEYGDDVARFYRDGAVCFWRHYKPKFRSEGASSTHIHPDVTIGLTGLGIEARENKNWTEHFSPAEVELACRYATYELNGFPFWFPDLFDAHSDIVCKFLLQEIRYELSIENSETQTHYVMSDVYWSGQWTWDKLAPEIYEQLKEEPQNLSNLDKLLTIVQGSSLSDEQVENLASEKSRTELGSQHQARWFAVWTGVSPETAIASLNKRLSEISYPENRTLFAIVFVAHLLGDRRDEGACAREAFHSPKHLKSLYMLMHEHIRPDEDINRTGGAAYTLELRDKAQDARDGLFNLLNQIPGKEAYSALYELSRFHPKEKTRKWINLQAKKRAELDSEMEPWSPEDVREFNDKMERTPKTHKELAEFAVLRLHDLKYDLEDGDSSIAGILQTVTQETEMRKFIGGKLGEKANGRYSISQEEELADAKKPDLRFLGVDFDGPVPVELKLADNWSGPKLFERLENQLCRDYLRDNRSTRGIYLLIYRGDKSRWQLSNGRYVIFSDLIDALQGHWRKISPNFPSVEDIRVVGIDLMRRSNPKPVGQAF